MRERKRECVWVCVSVYVRVGRGGGGVGEWSCKVLNCVFQCRLLFI